MASRKGINYQELAITLHPGVLRSWWRKWRTLPVRSWVLGAYYFHRKEYSRAASYYQKGLAGREQHKAAVLARLDLAYCLLQIGEWQQAEQEFYALTRHSQAPDQAFLLLSRLQLDLGNSDLAIRVLRRFVERGANTLKAQLCLFEALFSKGYKSNELNYLRENFIKQKTKLELDDELRPYLETALAAYEITFGDRLQGEQQLARVIASGSFPLEALVLRAQVLLDSGRSAQAISVLERALRIKPDYMQTYRILSKAYLMTVDDYQVESARQAAEHACRLSFWQNPHCVKQLADCYEVSADPLAAVLMAERALELARKIYRSPANIKQFQQQVERLRGALPDPDSLPNARQ